MTEVISRWYTKIVHTDRDLTATDYQHVDSALSEVTEDI